MGHLVFIGFGTGGGGGGGADPLLFPLDLYVASTGNDANPGTPALPVLTMNGAWSKVRDLGGNLTYQIGAPIRVHVAAFPAGTLQWTPVPGYQAINASGEVIVYGDGALQGVEDGFTVVATGAAGAATTATSVDFAAAPDAFLGRTLEFTTGPAAGQRRLVRNNTATEIIPDAAFTAAPIPGNTFRILAPAASIGLTSSADIQVSDDINVTLINLDADAGGGSFALQTLGVTCLKMYGCTFSGSAHISFTDSNVYAGLALGQVPENIGLGSLWAALGGIQDWRGWGVSSPADSLIANNSEPCQSLTGYAVSFGEFNPSTASDISLSLFGGFFGAMQTAAGSLTFKPGTVPTLVRNNGASSFSLNPTRTNVLVEGGDAALLLESPVSAGLFSGLIWSTLAEILWTGPCTFTTANLAYFMNGGTTNIHLQDGQFVGLFGGSGFYLQDGADLSITCFGDNGGMGGILGEQGIFAIAFNGSIFRLAKFATLASAPLPTINISAVNPATSLGFNALNGSEFILAADIVLTDIGACFLNEVDSILNILGTVTATNMNLFSLSVVKSRVTFGDDVTLTGAGAGFVNAAEGQTYIQGDLNVSSSGPIAITVEGSLLDMALSTGLATTATSPAFVTVADGTLLFGGSVTSDGNTFLCAGDSKIILSNQGNYTSISDTCFIVNSGSRLTVTPTTFGPSTINAALNGIDCTGGGQAYFQDGTVPPIFTVGGNELVVGPGILEQSTFALALPNPGDGFANAATTSSISRNL